MKKILFTVLFTLLFSHTVTANVEVNFIEGAPKDTFMIQNTGNCDFNDLVLEIDLSTSAGRLIFDTTATGAGVDVFQPFEVSQGKIELLSSKDVKDGDSKLSIRIPNLATKNSVSFTIDVDDTLPKSELGKIRISGSEIENGLVKITKGLAKPASASFANNNKAIILLAECVK